VTAQTNYPVELARLVGEGELREQWYQFVKAVSAHLPEITCAEILQGLALADEVLELTLAPTRDPDFVRRWGDYRD
jgi:hypothetical protein